jgi:HAMP domain-containing protein
MIIIMGSLSLLAIFGIGATSYKISIDNAIKEAKAKGEIIFNQIRATRLYFKEQQRPLIMELVEQDRFYPELMSGFVVTRETWDIFKQKLTDYDFKQATIDPLYPKNKADADELKIIRDFQANPDKKMSEGIIHKDGVKQFYMALPIKVDNKNCLRCHGNPEDAPKDQIEIYGDENGYHWEMGETVAAYIISISLSQAMEDAKKSNIILFSIGAVCIFFAIIGTWLFLDRSVVAPIIKLSNRTEEISLGKQLNKTIEAKSNDEIGILTKAIERLRVSMKIIIERSTRER